MAEQCCREGCEIPATFDVRTSNQMILSKLETSYPSCTTHLVECIAHLLDGTIDPAVCEIHPLDKDYIKEIAQEAWE